MTDQNTVLLVKQLALSELEGDIRPAPTGFWVNSHNHGMLCLWNEQAFRKPEQMIHELAADARMQSIQWHDTLLLIKPQSLTDCLTEFTEALYIYGQSNTELLNDTPDSVMIAMTQPRISDNVVVKRPVDPDEIAISEEMIQASESMLHITRNAKSQSLNHSRLLAAYKGNNLVGACKCRDTELSTRITELGVNSEIATESVAALTRAIIDELTSRFGLFAHAWVARQGKIRFPLAEAGFALAYKCMKLSGIISI